MVGGNHWQLETKTSICEYDRDCAFLKVCYPMFGYLSITSEQERCSAMLSLDVELQFNLLCSSILSCYNNSLPQWFRGQEFTWACSSFMY